MSAPEHLAPPLLEIFAELARTRADHPALVGATRTVTYAQLWQRGNQGAHALRGAGVGDPSRRSWYAVPGPS